MTFKLYDGKSSVLKKNTRYIQGGYTQILPRALGWWEKFQTLTTDEVTDIRFVITTEFALRPDKVGYMVYSRNDLGWLVLQYNNIVDINTEFVAGKEIILPSPVRVFSEILTNPIRYQEE